MAAEIKNPDGSYGFGLGNIKPDTQKFLDAQSDPNVGAIEKIRTKVNPVAILEEIGGMLNNALQNKEVTEEQLIAWMEENPRNFDSLLIQREGETVIVKPNPLYALRFLALSNRSISQVRSDKVLYRGEANQNKEMVEENWRYILSNVKRARANDNHFADLYLPDMNDMINKLTIKPTQQEVNAWLRQSALHTHMRVATNPGVNGIWIELKPGIESMYKKK